MSTYLELVNLAIAEAGKDQDDLTSLTFASPPDPRMYNRFKRWVNESYKEIQMARNEWEFKTGRATVLAGPSVYVEEGSRATAPTVGSTYIGADTGFALVVQQVILHSGDWALGTAKATIYFSVPDTTDAADFKFNEVITEDVPVSPGTSRIKGWGRYDFSADGQVADLLEVLVQSVSVQTTGGATIQDNDADVGLRPLVYVPWSTWDDVFDVIAGSRGKPRYVTTAPDGSLEFYPRPDKQYVVHFTYTKTDGTMTLFSDTPANIPARYHDIIAWMAVRKSGMYDRDRTITGRADERIRYYRNSMERNLMPLVAFEPSRFNRE